MGSAKQLPRLEEALACLTEHQDSTGAEEARSCLVPVAKWQQTAQRLKQPPFDVRLYKHALTACICTSVQLKLLMCVGSFEGC